MIDFHLAANKIKKILKLVVFHSTTTSLMIRKIKLFIQT